MDPIGIILSALVNGAATGLKDSASSAIKDAYSAFRSRLAKKFNKVPVEQIEKDPDDRHTQEFAAHVIAREGCALDKELLQLASNLLELVGSSRTVTVNISDSKVVAKAEKGNVLVGSPVNGDVSYTHQEFNYRSPKQRFASFKNAPEYHQYLQRTISRGLPIRYVFLFLFGIPFLIFAGLGLIIMGYALWKIVQHMREPVTKFPAIVSHKNIVANDSFTPNRLDLLKEDGTTYPVVAPHRLYNGISVGNIGMAFVAGSGELRGFVAYSED